MAAKFTNDGERWALQTAIANGGELRIHLARASFVSRDNMVPADFTEANFQGYAPILLVYSGLQGGNPSGRAVADFANALWTCTGTTNPNSIHGYWVQAPADKVILVERFTGSPRPMTSAGMRVGVTIQMRLWSPI